MNRLTKKLLSLLLSVAVLIPFVGLPITANATENAPFEVSGSYSLSDGVSSFPSGDSISVDSDAVSYLKTQLSNLKSTVTLNVTVDRSVDEAYVKNYAVTLFNQAVEHTGNPIQGDYILYQLISWTYSITVSYNYEQADMTINYSMQYFIDKRYEETLSTKVDEIIQSLDLNGKSDYRKVKLIYDYLCENVDYDYAAAHAATMGAISNPISHSAYGALCNGKAVCQGYVTALYRLLLTVGIDCRVISGKSSGANHAWNIVRLEGKYYLLDSTWDADEDLSKHDYFLKCEDEFKNHSPDEEFTTEYFKTNYPIASSSYKIDTIQNNSYTKIGDFTGDGEITSEDSLLVLRVSVGLEKTTSVTSEIADVNNDQTIDSLDSLEILRYSVVLPACERIGQKI